MIKLGFFVRKVFSSVVNPVPKSDSVVLSLFADETCNSRCVWCPNQYDLSQKLIRGTVSFKVLQHFLDLNDSNKFPLITYGQSEPTIHRDFVRFCNYILDRGWIISGVHTNLSSPYLDDEVFKTICRFKYVTVNFGGATMNTQFRNMETNLTILFDNLRRLVELSNGSGLKIRAKMVLNKNNFNEVDLLKEKLLKIDSEIEFNPAPLYFSVSDSDEKDKRNFFEANLGSFVDTVPCRENVSIDGLGVIHTFSKLKRCYGLNTTIQFNGDVRVCCRARWYGGVVGNAFVSPMNQILQSDEYKLAESNALKREYVKYCEFCS